MKLGTETGSLINHLQSRATIGQPEPIVGMGATELLWTDRHACTIFRVWEHGKFRYIEVRRDIVKRADNNGMSDCQDWDCKPNVNGSKHFFRQPLADKNAAWLQTYKNEHGRWVKGSHTLVLGRRDEYHDFSF